MTSPSHKVVYRPDSAPEIEKIADRVLRSAGAVGVLPTPIDDLIKASKVKDETQTQGILEKFLSTISEQGRLFFRSSLQKLRGLADIRERAIYVPQDTPPRLLFVKGHELGHEVLPWQQVNTTLTGPLYYDDDVSLSQEARELFDIEANYFAGEVIFQGKRFTTRARDYKPSFEAIFKLADDHGASKQATLHRYVDEQDETLAAVSYLPSYYETDNQDLPVLVLPRLIGSPRFNQRYGDIQLPLKIQSDHPWVEARNNGIICGGDINLPCGSDSVRFEWHAWWNSYNLFVLLRRHPVLSLSRLLARSK